MALALDGAGPWVKLRSAMDRLARRYLITGGIGIASMLTALGFVLYKASEKVSRADAVVKPAASADAGKSAAPPAASASAAK